MNIRIHLPNIVVLTILMMIAILTWTALTMVTEGAKENIEKTLKTTLKTSQQALHIQNQVQKMPVQFWARDKTVLKAAKALLALPAKVDVLLEAPAQQEFRNLLDPVLKAAGYLGFFVISNENISLASSRNNNVGNLNLLAEQPLFLEKVRAGNTLISLPQASDAPLPDYEGEFIERLATFFSASPIVDEYGKTIAVLAFRIDPDKHFKHIFERGGRFGETGETYAFNKKGQLLNESRFIKQLRNAGLLRGKHSDLNIEVRDPGVNLLRGKKSLLERERQPLTLMAKHAIARKAGISLDGYRGYYGVEVIGAWLWDESLGFGIATEIDREEVFAHVEDNQIIILVFAALLSGSLVLLWGILTRGRRHVALSHRQALKAKREAELANKAKSEFLSSMSHELRTPLNAILGFSQLLEESQKTPLTERQRIQVGQISKAGKHLLALIEEILDLSKIETGKLDISMEHVDLSPVLDECLQLTNALAKKHRVQLENESADCDLVIRADRLRVKQVLLNLLSNAVKYNREDGKVWVSCEEVDENYLQVAIKDNGIGISAEEQASLFQPFCRLGALQAEVEGTGIGLFLTKKLVDEMGGEISFESSPGIGSTFRLRFSLIKKERLAKSEQGLEESDSGIRKFVSHKQRLMLYVEDNPANLSLMEDFVRDIQDLSLIPARTAEIGLILAETEKPDVIVLDINLPGMDGNEAVRALKSTPVTSHIPVLALSANAMPDAIEHSLEQGFERYLTKPLDLKELVKALNKILDDTE